MPFVRYISNDVSQDHNHQYDPLHFPVHQPIRHNPVETVVQVQALSSYVDGNSSPLQCRPPYLIGGSTETLPFSHLQQADEPPPDWQSSLYFPFSTGDQ